METKLAHKTLKQFLQTASQWMALFVMLQFYGAEEIVIFQTMLNQCLRRYVNSRFKLLFGSFLSWRIMNWQLIESSLYVVDHQNCTFMEYMNESVFQHRRPKRKCRLYFGIGPWLIKLKLSTWRWTPTSFLLFLYSIIYFCIYHFVKYLSIKWRSHVLV